MHRAVRRAAGWRDELVGVVAVDGLAQGLAKVFGGTVCKIGSCCPASQRSEPAPATQIAEAQMLKPVARQRAQKGMQECCQPVVSWVGYWLWRGGKCRGGERQPADGKPRTLQVLDTRPQHVRRPLRPIAMMCRGSPGWRWASGCCRGWEKARYHA